MPAFQSESCNEYNAFSRNHFAKNVRPMIALTYSVKVLSGYDIDHFLIEWTPQAHSVIDSVTRFLTANVCELWSKNAIW